MEYNEWLKKSRIHVHAVHNRKEEESQNHMNVGNGLRMRQRMNRAGLSSAPAGLGSHSLPRLNLITKAEHFFCVRPTLFE